MLGGTRGASKRKRPGDPPSFPRGAWERGRHTRLAISRPRRQDAARGCRPCPGPLAFGPPLARPVAARLPEEPCVARTTLCIVTAALLAAASIAVMTTRTVVMGDEVRL